MARAAQYQDNLRRERLATSTTDLPSYLRGLEMRAVWSRFDRLGQPRIVQLINKTNQFNLTTRRETDEEVAALIGDPLALTLQIRLLDRFGDNGIIAIVIGAPEGDAIRLRHLADELPRVGPRRGGGDAEPGRGRGANALAPAG